MIKAIAVPYIIAILLGVAVIGLVGYWLFFSGGKFSGESLSLECNNQKLIFCQGGSWNEKCGDSSKIDCNQILGISGGAGGGGATRETSIPKQILTLKGGLVE